MWAYYPETKDTFAAFSKSREAGMGELVFSERQAPSGLQGLVMAEALNVLESTQLTPLQLQARVAELEVALREAVAELDGSLGETAALYFKEVLGE